MEDVQGSWHDYDFLWVELPDCDPSDLEVWRRVWPYYGANVYWVVIVEYLVKVGIVRPDGLRKGLRASRRVDPKDLEQALDEIGDALARAGPSQARSLR